MGYQGDSPLSITASIAGILTFVVAVAAALYGRWTYLRNADNEYFQVKASLNWYKTESTWMDGLIHSSDGEKFREGGSRMEYEMYVFVMDQLQKLEERLLEVVAEAEEKASRNESEEDKRWTFVPRGMSFGTGIAMSWLPVRTKALELMRQRDALGGRLLFAQMSMISSRVRDQESQSSKRAESDRERLKRLETMVYSQHEKLDRLESLVYRVMHRDRVGRENSPTKFKYDEDYSGADQTDETASTSWQSEINEDISDSPRKPVAFAR